MHRLGTRWSDDQEVRWRRVQSAPCTRRRGVQVSWLSLETKVDDLSVVWCQNHWDGLLVIWPQNHCDGFFRFGLKIGGDGFSWFGLKTGGFGFPGSGLKTGSYSLVIWALKSAQQFLSLGLKTKQVFVCRLRHKIDGRMKMAWGMRQNLVACFAWNQVGLGFFSLPSRLAETQR
jgi:hypothetical protein